MLVIFFIYISLTDNEDPAISCPDSQTVNTDTSQSFATVTWTDPEGSDNSGQNPTITCGAMSGSQFEIGETKVDCEALDVSEKQKTCSFTITVEGKNKHKYMDSYN